MITIEYYQTESKEWRWRIRARNRRIIANGGESYKRKGAMLKTLQKLIACFRNLDLYQFKEVKS